MNLILILAVIILIVVTIYRVAHMFTSNKMTANEDYFEQAGVKVDFKQGTIKIKGNTYDVKKVTGVNTVTRSGGQGMGAALQSTVGMVEIAVDDFKRPIHRITISGGKGKAPEFAQRLYVAIRKAGGPDFY